MSNIPSTFTFHFISIFFILHPFYISLKIPPLRKVEPNPIQSKGFAKAKAKSYSFFNLFLIFRVTKYLFFKYLNTIFERIFSSSLSQSPLSPSLLFFPYYYLVLPLRFPTLRYKSSSGIYHFLLMMGHYNWGISFAIQKFASYSFY